MACGLNIITAKAGGSAVGPSTNPPIAAAQASAENNATLIANQMLAKFKCPTTCMIKRLVAHAPTHFSNLVYAPAGAGKTRVQVTATVSMVVSCTKPVVVLTAADLKHIIDSVTK